MKWAAAVLAVTAGAATAASPPASQLVTRDVFLMGTRATLATYADTRERGLVTLEAALGVLEEAEAELSTWRASSAISSLNRQPVGTPWHATPALCGMLAEIWRWHEDTGGAFDPAIGRLLAAYDIHGAGIQPSPHAERAARSASGLELLSFDTARCTVTRRAPASVDVGAFGKGEALDRVRAALGDVSWMIDLGGQVAVGGMRPHGWLVGVADPLHRDRPALTVRLTGGSLSTSGGSERDLAVDGRRVSHIFDPRTGRPASFTGSVTVWHRGGLAADALSTALFVMGPAEGLQWAESRGVAAMFLIPEGGRLRRATTPAFESAADVRIIERE